MGGREGRVKPRAHSSIRPAYSPSDSGRLRRAQRLAHNDAALPNGAARALWRPA